METKWTAEQKQVIELRDRNILVSAAAGSGKTAVLVERILSLLTDPKDPADVDRLLIVTFTNAAAGEMRDRIRARIEEELEKELPPQLREHLQRQISLLQNAQISTIHSFCQYVIRNYFHTIGLDPNFRIAEDGEQKLLQHDVMEELLEKSFASGSPEFRQMVESLSTGRDDSAVGKTVLELYAFAMSFPWPDEWLRQCAEAYEIRDMQALLDLPWMKDLEEAVRTTAGDAGILAEQALQIAQSEGGPYMYEEALLSDQTFLGRLAAAQGYEEMSELLTPKLRWKTLSGKKDPEVPEELKDQVKLIRDVYKKEIGKLQESYFYAPLSRIAEQIRAMQPFMKTLLELTEKFEQSYTKAKRDRGLCDFSDLEHLALEILIHEEHGEKVRSAAAKELALCYREIMIDEYQDSNMVQEMLLTSIAGRERGAHNLFMVGDVKQSIYRFRLARPEIFVGKFDRYSLTEGPDRRIDLHKNFRSRPEVLESVNALFDRIMGRDLGGVEYDADARLNPGAVFAPGVKEQECQSELLLLDLDKEKVQDSEENSRELEARMIGCRIRELVGSHPVWDKNLGAYRPAGYGDIVILLRAVSGWTEQFVKILGDMGIPCFAGARNGYFQAPEVQTVLAYLKLIDNPRQDIPMTAVLRSPMAGISAAALAGIRSRSNAEHFYEACMEAKELQPFFEQLASFRERSLYLPVQELLRELLEETGYLDYASAMPAGAQRRANLDMLLEKAAAYEAGSYHGLYNFIRYIENLHKYEVDFGEANAGGQEENMVRILSIHKSKGLEFPIVFVAGLGKQMNRSDMQSQLVWHVNLGIGCDFVDPVLRIKGPTLYKNYIKEALLRENLGEELRVLYVALTRAKEKLILTGAVADLEEKLQKWETKTPAAGSRLRFSDRAGARTDLDWIMPVMGTEELQQTILLKTWQIDDLVGEEQKRQQDALLTEAQLREISPDKVFDEKIRERLEEQLTYRYRYEDRAQIPSKFSVSELKKMSQAETQEFSELLYEEPAVVPCIPDFLKDEEKLTGAARGTIYHKVMEHIDLSADVQQEMERLCEGGQVTEEELKSVDPEKIRRFERSMLGQRMRAAQREGALYREQQFVMELQADEIRPEWSNEEFVLIQGIIDAYFIENGEIVLVDYKTDFVKLQEASSLYEKYRVQLECYQKALERLTGRKVKETYLYSFCLNRELTESEGTWKR